jgi:SAM-dependent methyltransferase
MSVYGICKTAFRGLLPESARYQLWHSNNPVVMGLANLKNQLKKTATNHDIYDADFFKKLEAVMKTSAPIIADSVIKQFQPQSVIDVGCGTGDLLFELSQRGINCMGLEYAEAALERCRTKGLHVVSFDIESTEEINQKADLVISTEVAEHLPATYADRYVDLLTGISNVVTMTAAPPGQGGTDHVNEQPNEYWIDKFARRGFHYEQDISMKFRREWKEKNVESWYYSNVMIFTNKVGQNNLVA